MQEPRKILGDYFASLSSIDGYEAVFIQRQTSDINSVKRFVVPIDYNNESFNSPFSPEELNFVLRFT